MRAAGKISGPPPEAIADSLRRLRKEHNPLAPKHVAHQYILLLAPFAQAIEPLEERPAHLRAAIELASAKLSEPDRTVVEHILLRESGMLKDARRAAFDALCRTQVHEVNSPKVVENRESAVFLRLAEILVSESFADDFARAQGLKGRPASVPSHQPGIVCLRWCWAIDFRSLTRVVWHKSVRLRVVLPEQRVFEHRYHDELAGKPSEPIHVITKGHSYLGTAPDNARGRPGWWADFIHFGRIPAVGETIEVAWQAAYTKAEPFLAVTAAHEETQELYLAIRLPPEVRGRPAQAEVVADPYNHRIPIGEPWEVKPSDDGWVVQHFTELAHGLQYGLYFHGLDIYDT